MAYTPRCQYNENHQGHIVKASTNPLHIHEGPITRDRAKKMQAAYSNYWATKYTISIKSTKGNFGIKLVLIKPEVM